MSETWLILGATSPIAGAFAAEVASRGDSVVLAGRDIDELERTSGDLRLRTGATVSVLRFDAAAVDEHDAFVAACRAVADSPVSVLLAFGAMPAQARMDAEPGVALEAARVNYLGAMSVLHRLAPVFEEQRAGHIVVLGSVAGDRGRLKNYVYGSAKAGLHAYVSGLRARLLRAGVPVTLVKLGFVDTSMTWTDGHYKRAASPRAAAKACLRFADKGADVRYYPRMWGLVMLVVRMIPERIFKRLSF